MSQSKLTNVYVTGTIRLAACSYKAVEEEELSFAAGDVVTVLAAKGDSCYQAMLPDGTIGLVNVSHLLRRTQVPLLPMPWFHGAVSRFEAEKLLDRNRIGQFLVRTTQHGKGVLAVSLSCPGGIQHYLIVTESKTKRVTIDGNNFFKNLPELIEHYKEDEGCLKCRLLDPLGRKGALDFFVDTCAMKQGWGLPRKAVQIGDILGTGEFGDVYSGIYRGMRVAVKVMKEGQADSDVVSEFSREAAILTRLQHKNLVQVVGLLFRGSALKGIVMEMMGKGSLVKYLSTRGRSVVSPAQLISFALDVCDGMAYLSQQGFVHRDLAARNVLLNSNGEAKISDLGLARKAGIFVPHEGGKFPIKWTAPEALKYSRFSVKSDVWSFGILLWELYSYGRVPYPSVSVDDVVQFLEDGNVMDPPEDTPSPIYSTMLACWHLEPQDRPTFDDLRCMLESFKVESKLIPSSPSLTRQGRKGKTIPASFPIETLARSPEAATLYSDILRCNKMVTVYSANLLVTGPEGSGKTSLLRCFQEDSFRNVEPASLSINIASGFMELSKAGLWISSEAAFSMEENRLRSVVEELVQQMQKTSTPSQPLPGSSGTPPPLPTRNRPPIQPYKAATTDDIVERAGKDHPDGGPSPLLRSHSFNTGSSRNRVRQQNGRAVNRELPVTNGVHKAELNVSLNAANASNSPSKLRKIIGSFRRYGSVRRHAEDSGTNTRTPQNGSHLTASPEPYIPSDDSTHSSSTSIPNVDENGSRNSLARNSLEDSVVRGLIYGLEQCQQQKSLPPALFGRLIDLPGASVHSLLRPLFFTKRSVAVVTFDLSRRLDSTQSLTRYGSSLSVVSSQNNGSRLFEIGYVPRTYLDHIAGDMMGLFHHIPRQSLEEHTANCRMLLVGTHSDKMSSFSCSREQLTAVKEAVDHLPCRPFFTPSQFAVSSSSILEQAKMEDLKQCITNLVKTHGRQQVPIRWLEATAEVKALAESADHIQPKAKMEDVLARFCISSEEIEQLLEFLHDNLIIFHLPHIHMMKDVVVISPSWFAHHASLILSVALPTNSEVIKPFRQEIALLKSTGKLSGNVISHVWWEISPTERSHLLTLLHKMDLLVCLGDQDEVMALHTQQQSALLLDCPVVSATVIPALVSQHPPDQLFAEPDCNIEPLYFRVKGGFLPSGLYLRLIARCICNYPRCYCLYSGLATFAVDDATTVFVQEVEESIRIWVQVEESTSRPSSPAGPTPSAMSAAVGQPSSDVCMTVLMFIKAAISDIIQQWIPQLDFDLCVECSCKGERDLGQHYAILNDTEDWMGPQGLVCEEGSEITPLVGVTRWFGSTEEDMVDMAVANDKLELANEGDIQVISSLLGKSWWDLGEILGFSSSELHGIFATSALSTIPDAHDTSPDLSSRDEGRRRSSSKEDLGPIPKSLSISSIASSMSSTSRSSVSTSRLIRKMRQDPFLTPALSIPSTLPPGERLLLQWQSDQGDEATLTCLISALELIQRRDIAENVIKSRVEGQGFVI